MTLSFWRYTHLALAVVSSLFLLLASLSGSILAIDALQEKMPNYKVSNFEDLKLKKSIDLLKKKYPEITELSVDHNQYVRLRAMDANGRDIDNYIDPHTGKILGEPIKKSEFIQWITAFHRSLFLHELGRFIVGLISFILVLISISGFVLLLKRQKGLRNYFSKIFKDNLWQYYHVLLGRWALLPILIIALTGTYLSLEKFNFFLPEPQEKLKEQSKDTKQEKIPFAFEHCRLSEIEKVEFPFSEDPEDYYIIHLKDRELEVHQTSGLAVSQKLLPSSKLLTDLSLDLHTGRGNAFWALVLAIAGINILFFIYSGFSMTFQRRRSRIKNHYKAHESKIILLVGSENGSSLHFANAIQKQLLHLGKKAFLTEMNKYNSYPNAEHLLVFTSTHGQGDPPSNANKFIGLLNQIEQAKKIKTAVIGFGSTSYPNYCEFAKETERALEQLSWTERFLPLHSVNDKSAEEFAKWVKTWSEKSGIQLLSNPSLYNHMPKGLQKLRVLAKTETSQDESTFILSLDCKTTAFESGDLLSIYPANDARERLYSIGKHNGNIQLVIKLHPNGLGSGYLHQLQLGQTIKGRILSNPNFHLPKAATKIALISNGAGIAPFLGMIEQNKKKTSIHLYSGFRKETQSVLAYKKFAQEMIEKQQLKSFTLAFSREEKHDYVMDLIRADASFFKELLSLGGHLMICGSLAMQSDVEAVLSDICEEHTNHSYTSYKEKRQIHTDCY